MVIDVGGKLYLLLSLLLKVTICKIVYEWNEIHIKNGGIYVDWRPTSFEYSDNKFYITLIDVNKNSMGVGIVAWFTQGNHPSPSFEIHGDRNDYRIYSEEGTIMAPMLIRTDPCGDVWIMDANIYNISGAQVKSTPILHIYDRKTTEKNRVHHFQDNVWEQQSLFTNLVFLVQESIVPRDPNYCAALIAYLADFNGSQLFAYHYHEDTHLRYSHPSFLPDPYVEVPDEYLFNKEHQKLTGIYGLALAKTTKYGSLLFFHRLASTIEFVIPAEKLKNESVLNYGDVRMSYEKGKLSEAGRTVFDPVTETFFFAELRTREIGCLNLHTILNKETSVPTYGRYNIHLRNGIITDLKIIGGELWILTYSPSKITLRKELVSEIIRKAQCIVKFKDTKCDSFDCQRSGEIINASSVIDFNFCKLLITVIIILTF